MTKRRPSNKKPTGVNTSLGNSLANERRKARTSHILTKFHQDGYTGNSLPNHEEKKNPIKSVTEETSLEEFLAKVQLAKNDFTAERENVRIVEQSTSSLVPTKKDILDNLELQQQYSGRLRIPRRPAKGTWHSAEELTELENKNFLEWRKDLAELQQVDGLVLTPFERNLELWKQLWRVVEQSDIVVQIVDARNPLLFRNVDLEEFVKECDPAKQNVILVNKTDLLTDEQVKLWEEWFAKMKIDAVFWSALGSQTVAEQSDNSNTLMSTESPAVEQRSVENESASDVSRKIPLLYDTEELLNFFKSRAGLSSSELNCRRVIVGMVGYPNVGKSSTINKILGKKKVSVSSTPGKTRHLQTLVVDKELTLCDCPGLVMPSFALSRDVMLLNGILPVDQMREYFSPIALLATYIPRKYFEVNYSIMLPPPAQHEDPNRPPTAHELLTSVAFMKGFMSAAGIPDCSRAARLIIKDVVNGKIKWIAAPPGISQEEFNNYTYGKFLNDDSKKTGNALLYQLEKRHLLCSSSMTDKAVDEQFFSLSHGGAHIISPNTLGSRNAKYRIVDGRISLKKGKKEKLRRLYAHLDA